jgi:hypothetical protein
VERSGSAESIGAVFLFVVVVVVVVNVGATDPINWVLWSTFAVNIQLLFDNKNDNSESEKSNGINQKQRPLTLPSPARGEGTTRPRQKGKQH